MQTETFTELEKLSSEEQIQFLKELIIQQKNEKSNRSIAIDEAISQIKDHSDIQNTKIIHAVDIGCKRSKEGCDF
jgi:hypothetical protein